MESVNGPDVLEEDDASQDWLLPHRAAWVWACVPRSPLQSRRGRATLLCCLAEVEQLVSECFPSLGAAPFLVHPWLERVGFCYHVGLFGVLSLCLLAFLVGQFLPARIKSSKFNHRVIPWVPRFLTHLSSFHCSVSLGLFYIQHPEVLVVLGRRNRGKYTYSISRKRKVFWFFFVCLKASSVLIPCFPGTSVLWWAWIAPLWKTLKGRSVNQLPTSVW